MALSASHVLQKSPQFIVKVLKSGLPEGQTSALIKAGRFPATIPESSWPVGQEVSSAGRSISVH